MKKAMWIITIICLALTVVAMTIFPDSIPMHYNLAGEIDRWGSKYESFLIPAFIVVFCLIFHFVIKASEKKANDIMLTEKERAEAKSNAKVLGIIGVISAIFFTILQTVMLYTSYVEAMAGATHAHVDIVKVTFILVGVLFIVAGNFMPKAKRNRTLGVKTDWSLYNDATWMKSNRFGGIAFVVMGIAIIITALLVPSRLSLFIILAYVIIDTVVIIAYSYRVYKEELKKDGAV